MSKLKTPVDKPFYDATKNVFKSMLDMEITLADSPEKSDADRDVTVTIGLTGDLSGNVVFRFPESTTLNIVKSLSGMEIGKVDDFAASMLGEMANIISGNAVSALSELDCRCDIRPPEISMEQLKQTNGSGVLRSPAGELREEILLSPEKA